MMRPRSSFSQNPLDSVATRYRHPLVSAAACGRSGTVRRRRTPVEPVAVERVAGQPVAQSGEPARNEKMQRIEAVLFLAREPLSSRKLSQYADLADGTEARTLIGRLNALYDRSGRAFRVEQIAGGYQLLTRQGFARWLRRQEDLPAPMRLSAPTMETLAVVAYRQPVLRVEIEAIRGVASGEILRQLMERELVRISGRSEELGRPYLYATTKRFLQLFGLRSLEELPRSGPLGPVVAGEEPLDEQQETVAAIEVNDEANDVEDL